MNKFLFKELLKNSDFNIILRSENKKKWDTSMEQFDYFPVLYTNASIDFQEECLLGNGQDCEDYSIMFINQNKILALWPLSLIKKNNSHELNSFLHSMLHPIIVRDASRDIKKKLFKETVRIINSFKLEKESISSISVFQNKNSLDFWNIGALDYLKEIRVEYDLLLNLSPSIEEIKKNLRKSTKSSITQSAKLWEANILKKENKNVWNSFKQLHLEAAGRSTRSDLSWEIQEKILIEGNSFLVYISNKKDIIVGGGLFTISKDECEYSVAAYNRSLFDQPLGHLVQIKAIEEMKKRNIKFYKLGRKSHELNEPKPSTKEVSISLFKEGFSSIFYPILISKHNFKNLKI